MALKRIGTVHDRGAMLPSLGAATVVAVVLLANGWSMVHSTPELAPMAPLERLSAMREAARLPPSASASAGPTSRSDAITGGGRAGAPIVARVSATAAVPTIRTATTRSYVVQPGENLGLALAHLFITPATSRDIIKAYELLHDANRLQAGWRLWGRFSSAGVMDSAALQQLVVAPPHGEGLTISRDSEGGFVASEGGLPGTVTREALRCGIVGTLEASLRRCGEGDGLVEVVQPVLAERLLAPIELRTGDEVRLVMDKLMDGDILVRYQSVAAIEVRAHGERTVALFFDKGRGAGAWYTPDGQALEPLFLRQPLRIGHATSGFGMRLHPILHRMKAHYGLDFGAPRGTPVWSAADGHLVSAGRAGAAGNMVRVRHADGYASEYMHLQKFAPGLKSRDSIAKGDVIGYVGSTGRSTGPHLHLGIKRGGRYLDPASLADVSDTPVAAHDRKAFEDQTAPLLRLLEAVGKVPASGDAA